MFKEGSNWTHAERAIICDYRGSVVELIQMCGRVLRDIPEGEKHPEIYQILSIPSGTEDEVKRDWINDRICQFSSLLLLENIFDPVKNLKRISKVDESDDVEENYVDNGATSDNIPVNYVVEACGGDTSQMEALLQDLSKLSIYNCKKEEFFTKAEELMKAEGYVESYILGAISEVWRGYKKMAKRIKKRHISELSDQIDMVDEYYPATCICNATSYIGLEKLDSIREVLGCRGQMKSFEEHKDYILNVLKCSTPAAYDRVKNKKYGYYKFFWDIFVAYQSEEKSDIFPYLSESKSSLGEHIKFATENRIKSNIDWVKAVKNSGRSDLYIDLASSPYSIAEITGNIRKGVLTDMEKRKIDELFKAGKGIVYISNFIKRDDKSVRRYLVDNMGYITRRHEKFDLLNKTINNVYILEQYSKNGRTYIKGRCRCGEVFETIANSIVHGKTTSCGCFRRTHKKKSVKFLDACGNVILSTGMRKTSRDLGLGKDTLSRLFNYHIKYTPKGHCLYHPELEGITHQERLEKGLYEKYLKNTNNEN
jgi:hypothetical protein